VNRETKRMMDRQGRTTTDGAEMDADAFELGDFGTPRRGPKTVQQRTTPLQFAREVREELRQVAWPTRVEMVNYSLVVFFTLVIMISLIFVLNLAFGHGVVYMFQK
jgi:preprotein translocase subunit SecE